MPGTIGSCLLSAIWCAGCSGQWCGSSERCPFRRGKSWRLTWQVKDGEGEREGWCSLRDMRRNGPNLQVGSHAEGAPAHFSWALVRFPAMCCQENWWQSRRVL